MDRAAQRTERSAAGPPQAAAEPPNLLPEATRIGDAAGGPVGCRALSGGLLLGEPLFVELYPVAVDVDDS